MEKKEFEKLNVAIVQDWLVEYAGSDRVVDQIKQVFPNAPIYTLVYDKSKFPEHFQKYDVRTTYLQKIPLATKLYKKMLALMPRAWEALDLSEYDLIISNCSCCCKGVRKRPDALHICYCHTPIRYVWDMYDEYLADSGFLTRLFMPPIIKRIKPWDYAAAQKVDCFIANSKYIADRIKRDYHRESTVIYPGVHIADMEPCEPEDYYVYVGRFTGYKRADLAVQGCTRLGKRLLLIGSGSEEEKLRSIAGPTIEFKGYLSDKEKLEVVRKAKALIFPAEEDFGIVPVEAQSLGVPVLAFGKGGATETVLDGKTGLYFEEQTVDSLSKCIEQFEKSGVLHSRAAIRDHSLGFSEIRFKKCFIEYCQSQWTKHQVEA